LSKKGIIRIALILAVFSWLAMSLSDIIILFSRMSELVKPGIGHYFPDIFFILYALSLYVFYQYRIEAAHSSTFVDLLWKIFVTGLLTTVVSLLLKSLDFVMGNTSLLQNPVLIDSMFLIHLGLLPAFLISTFIVWKRLVLYQKTKLQIKAWTLFEYLLLVSLFSPFLPTVARAVVFYALILMGIFLSANMKWVAYLNFKQKWKSILLLILTQLYLAYFYMSLFDMRKTYEFLVVAQDSVFILSLLIFTGIYATFSLLVILFNLPTSSVFEQKLEEVVNFQRLSQSVQTEQSEKQVYEILLETSVRATKADAAWIEARVDEEDTVFRHNIGQDVIHNIKTYITSQKDHNPFDFAKTEKGLRPAKHLRKMKGVPFNSIVVLPITIAEEHLGMLVLLKELKEGFNKELLEITQTFVNQAGISIEGFRLMSEAIANERYKEELNIAKKVQSRLLPNVLDANDDFEITAFSAAADEVGGDYYDSFKINDDKVALIIGDVSGKGTSAAFHMSQMKGVFHGLAQLDLPPAEFLIRANRAISTSLDKTSFVTISYFVLDRTEKRVEFARAGHCPTLYFDHQQGKAAYFTNKGLGLGIVRNNSFANYVQPREFTYQPGDVLILYTDGITEAKNFKGEEFGYDRLAALVNDNARLDAPGLQQKIIAELYEFCGQTDLDDDYTTIIVKFK